MRIILEGARSVKRRLCGRRTRTLSAQAPNIHPVQIDVTAEDSIAAAARRVSESTAGAGLSGLVNNAGIGVAGPIEYLSIEDLRKEMEVNGALRNRREDAGT